MAKTNFKTIDEYIATLSAEDAAGVQSIRKAILKAVPHAEQVISYQIPAFKADGWVFYVSAFTQHYNLSIPPPGAAFLKFRKQLAKYSMSKASVRLPKSEPLPLELIGKMAAYQAETNRKHAKNRGAKK